MFTPNDHPSLNVSTRAHEAPVAIRARLRELFAQPSRSLESLDGRTVLLAVDHSEASHDAILMARMLADECGAIVHALQVMDDRSAPIPPPLDVAIGITDSLVGPAVQASREDALRQHIAHALGNPTEWTTRVRLGIPASTIASQASELGAALIVMGLRRHARIDRALGDETTLNVVRRATCPVLAVAAGSTTLPRTVLAAVDFSAHSVRAMRTARMLVPPQGRIIIAYAPTGIPYAPGDGEGVIHALGLDAAFRLARSVIDRGGVLVDHVTLHREPSEPIAQALLEYATEVHADVVSVGSVGHSFIDRLLVGSVSTDLVRDGRHSLLITPPLAT